MTTGQRLLALAIIVGLFALPAPGSDPPPTDPNGASRSAEATAPAGSDWSKAVAIIGACLGAALAALGGAYGVSRIGGQCIESIARQPEAARDMFAPMVVAAGMVEVGMLFAIVVCLLSLFQVG
jgi:F-type H+-transporting ATPase subunit c